MTRHIWQVGDQPCLVFRAISSSLHTGFTQAGQSGGMNSALPVQTLWFKRWGWFHRPVSLAGFITTLLPVAFCANVFWAVDRHSHSVSDTLYGVYPFFVCTFLLWAWLAGQTSEK